MSFSPVEYVWLVPAIPLAAMLIIFFVFRPIEALTTPRHEPAVTGAGGHGGHGAPRDPHPPAAPPAGGAAPAATATSTAGVAPPRGGQKKGGGEATHRAGPNRS